MKIAFFGTPQFAADILSGLMNYPEIETLLVVSQPDKAVGRKQELQATPVKQVALSHDIEVLQPVSLKRDRSFENGLRLLDLDFIVVLAYGKIIPKSLLDIPKYGCINLHGSILPAYRGASPVQAALRDGVSETGLTTMYMSERMDEGDILQIAKIKVDKVDRSPDIFQKFVDIGPELLRDTLVKIQNGELRGIPQNHDEATYCSKILKEDGEISFQKQSAEEIYNLFRAYTPWPGIYSYYQGKRLVIEEVFITKPHLGISSPQGEEDYMLRQGYTEVPTYIKELSKKLREKQTDAEKRVWEILRNRRFHNLKFRRQHAIGRYIADFYCDEKKLVIELDGKIHENKKEYDEVRDALISSHNIHIIRIPNEDIDQVYSIIYSELCSLSLLGGERIQEGGFVGEDTDIEPGTFLKIGKNRYGVASTDGNILEIMQVKLEGKKSMDIMSFVNGNKEILEYIFD